MGQIEIFNNFIYLKPFNYVQTNDGCPIELLVSHNYIWIHLTVCQQGINGFGQSAWAVK